MMERNMNFERINLFVCDVDGTLTDGGMYYDMYGNEWKKFNTRDGKGISLLRENGIAVMFLTSEDTPIVQRRAKKLEIEFCYIGIKDKKRKLDEFFRENLLFSYSNTAYIGDDINDLEVLQTVGIAAAPSNGVKQVKEIADYLCALPGGQGCVREFCEYILQLNNQKILKGASCKI